jgi:hypothetical protein
MEPVVLEVNAQEHKLLYEKGHRAYFGASRFYNPAITLWFTSANTVLRKDYWLAFNKNYFGGLSLYVQGVMKKELKEVIKGLKSLSDAVGYIDFKEFILFNGIFQDTVLLVNPNGRIQITVKYPKLPKPLVLRLPDEIPLDFKTVKTLPIVDDDSTKLQVDPIQEKEIVGAVILPEEYLKQLKNLSLKRLSESGSGKRPKDVLIELIDGRENVNTKEIGSLNFTNPFSQILSCNFEPEYNAFENALECLDNAKFNASLHPEKKTESGENKKRLKGDSQKRDERVVDGYKLPQCVSVKAIPQGAKTIQSHRKYGLWGFSNVLRDLPPEDREHEFTKSIRNIAEDHLAETRKYLIHYDRTRREYWTLAENKDLFQQRVRGRKKISL